MKKEDIIEILREFENSSLTVLKFTNGDIELGLEKQERIVPAQVQSQEAVVMQPPTVNAQETSDNFIVEAPLVASFYRAPAPDKDPFIEVGDTVKKGQVLFILEAMKMINEIKSPVSGKVIDIFPNNGELVEFGQPIVEIEVSDV